MIFEVGACQGEDTAIYAQSFPRSTIYAFEPLPENYTVLQKVMATMGERGKPFQLALSDTKGEVEFHVSSGVNQVDETRREDCVSRSSSLLSPLQSKPASLEWLKFNKSIKVSTDTLDNFCAAQAIRYIDFMHMDVQGAELKVLAGASRMLPHIGAIWMEVAFEPTYEGQPLDSETTSWMKKRGFRKIYQVSYGSEGDALFYNMQRPLAWLRFAVLRLKQRCGLIKR